jgi:hypothetical protein
MIAAARRAEFDYWQKVGLKAEAFQATPDLVIKAMLQAALKLIPADPAPTGQPPAEGSEIAKARGPR